MTNKEKVKAISRHYGYDSQSRQCIEEMGELTQAINKFWRKNLRCGLADLNDTTRYSMEAGYIIEELADVQVMIWQMQEFFDVANLDDVAGAKLDRQLQRMKEEGDKVRIQHDFVEKIKRALLRIHAFGGYDAEDEWARGWDSAITEALKIVGEETGVHIEEVLRENND